MNRRLLLLACVLIAARLSAAMVESLPLHLLLAGMDHPRPPLVYENHLVLSVGGAHRFVGAAFEHEGFAVIHPYERNQQGVFVLAYPLPLKAKAALAYRLVVDGVWMSDPGNPRHAAERQSGLDVSLAEVPYLSDERPGLYRILGEDGRTAHFLWKGEPGQIVTVAGTFNNWDPFIHELVETSPGVYELELPLPRGINYYSYIVGGESHPDPLNLDKASSREGRVVSVLIVKD